ncbi:MAG: DoxX family protein [Alphaproteobacteria bacterium]
MTALALRSASLADPVARHAHWFLRISLASVYLYHGLTKFPVLDGMAAMLGLPVLVVFLVALTETVGGSLILAGGFLRGALGDLSTRLGALVVMPVVLGAISIFHWGQWTFVASDSHPMGGMEFQVTLLLLQLFLIFKGNGRQA